MGRLKITDKNGDVLYDNTIETNERFEKIWERAMEERQHYFRTRQEQIIREDEEYDKNGTLLKKALKKTFLDKNEEDYS